MLPQVLVRSLKRHRFWIAAFAICLLLPLAASAGPAGPAIVRTDPPTAAIAVNQTMTLNLYVQDVTAMNAADVRLAFDPALLQVVDAEPTTPGIQITALSGFMKPDFVVRKKACNGPDPADGDCTGGGLGGTPRRRLTRRSPCRALGPSRP